MTTLGATPSTTTFPATAADVGAIPLAAPAGVIDTTTYDDSVSGVGKYRTLILPIQDAALAVAIAGDAFPRIVMTGDPTEGTYLGDGTQNPVNDGASSWIEGPDANGFFSYVFEGGGANQARFSDLNANVGYRLALQTGIGLNAGGANLTISTVTGAPTIGGNVGDIAIRKDPSGTNDLIYRCTVAGIAGAATWVAQALYAAGGTDVAVADGGTGAGTAAGARTNLGLVIGTDVAAPSAITATKLDDFATPDDNTDLNATTGVHGLLPKLGGGSTNFLRADGTWNAPAGGGAVDSVNGETGVVVLDAADVGAQPLDSDLTSIAGLATAAFGRSVLTAADAAALRALIGVSAMSQIDISQTPTTTNGAYLASDAVGGLLTFANAALTSGGSGILQTLRVLCKTPALMPALELWLFNQTFTAMADNGTWSPSDADMANYIGHIPIAAWGDTTTNSGASRFGLGFAYKLVGTDLFGQLVTRTAVSLTSTSDIIVSVVCIRD